MASFVIEDLPWEILQQIISFLNTKDALDFISTSKTLRSQSENFKIRWDLQLKYRVSNYPSKESDLVEELINRESVLQFLQALKRISLWSIRSVTIRYFLSFGPRNTFQNDSMTVEKFKPLASVLQSLSGEHFDVTVQLADGRMTFFQGVPVKLNLNLTHLLTRLPLMKTFTIGLYSSRDSGISCQCVLEKHFASPLSSSVQIFQVTSTNFICGMDFVRNLTEISPRLHKLKLPKLKSLDII